MASFRLSRAAEGDLLGIGAYTLQTWGESQTVRYLAELEACCQLLGDDPQLGRSCNGIRAGLYRMEHGRHVIFYRKDGSGILVSRMLHVRMLPERHSISSADEEQDD